MVMRSAYLLAKTFPKHRCNQGLLYDTVFALVRTSGVWKRIFEQPQKIEIGKAYPSPFQPLLAPYSLAPW